jgi:hypothetical protein
VETATYESEFVAARIICVEQIIDSRNTLRFLGVSVREKNYMFGDNKSVVNSSMQLNAKLHKRHTMLSFHHIRETIAEETLGFYFLPGDDNPAIILSIHWGLLRKRGDKSMVQSISFPPSFWIIGYISGERGVTRFRLFQRKITVK